MTPLALWWRALPALLSILLLGSGFTLALWRGPRRISIWEWLGWSWLAGTGAGSLLIGVLGLALKGPWLFGAMAALALASAVVGWRAQSGLRPQCWPIEAASWEKLSSLPLLALIGFALSQAFRQTLLADGLFIMEFKARISFLHGGQVPAQLFTDTSRLISHPSYPLLLPLSELWLYLGVGSADQTVAKTLFAPFYAAATLLLFGTVSRLSGKLWLGAVAVALSAGVPQLLLSSFSLEHGYADYPLACLFLAATASMLLPDDTGRMGGQWPLAALAAGLMPWAKAEGILLWALFAVAMCRCLRQLGWRARVLALAPGAAIWIGWQLVLRLLHTPAEQVFRPIDGASLLVALSRLWPVVNYFGHELGNTNSWGVLWWSLPVAVALAWRTPQRSRVVLAAALSVGALCLDVGPYLFTSLDLGFHLRTSCDRLVLQAAWPALLAIGLALAALATPPLRRSEAS